MTTLIALAAVAAAQSQSINDYVAKNLDDATMVARVVKGDQRELKKIKDDFGTSYRFQSTTIQFKEPYKLRLAAKVDDTTITYILNGSTLKINSPIYKGKQNLADAPGRRQTSMDFGVLTQSLFNGTFFTAKFVRADRATGDAVFDLGYIASLDDSSRHRIWIDPQKKYITKREWFNQHGRHLATFLYDNAKQFDGVWMPTQLTVKNVENKVAGVTRYDSIRVNSGLSDGLFSVN